jgi:hypothetical protein
MKFPTPPGFLEDVIVSPGYVTRSADSAGAVAGGADPLVRAGRPRPAARQPPNPPAIGIAKWQFRNAGLVGTAGEWCMQEFRRASGKPR